MGLDVEDRHEPYANGGVIGVFNFKKESYATIQLVCSAVSPIHGVLSFHSSMLFHNINAVLTPCTLCVMNFITFEGTYLLYPLAMFGARQALAIGSPKSEAYAQYTFCGWRIYNHLSDPDKLKNIFFPDRIRRVLDSKTWAINFDITDLPICTPTTDLSKAVPWDPALPNSWILSQIVADTACILQYSHLLHCSCNIL